MGALTKPAILLVAVYLFLKFVVPNIPGSAPLPASLIFLYLMLVTAGIVIFYTMSSESKDAFWGPIQRFLTGENLGALSAARYAVLVVFPLLVGWQTFGSTAVSDAPPAENRTIHPAPPGEYTGLSNPVAKTPENIMQGKGFYAGLVKFMTSAPVVALVLEGPHAVQVCRDMMGATFGFKAEAGTIRGDYGVSSAFNLIHGSDSPESAKAELALWFKPDELITYDLANRVWTYDFSKGTPE